MEQRSKRNVCRDCQSFALGACLCVSTKTSSKISNTDRICELCEYNIFVFVFWCQQKLCKFSFYLCHTQQLLTKHIWKFVNSYLPMNNGTTFTYMRYAWWWVCDIRWTTVYVCIALNAVNNWKLCNRKWNLEHSTNIFFSFFRSSSPVWSGIERKYVDANFRNCYFASFFFGSIDD